MSTSKSGAMVAAQALAVRKLGATPAMTSVRCRPSSSLPVYFWRFTVVAVDVRFCWFDMRHDLSHHVLSQYHGVARDPQRPNLGYAG